MSNKVILQVEGTTWRVQHSGMELIPGGRVQFRDGFLHRTPDGVRLERYELCGERAWQINVRVDGSYCCFRNRAFRIRPVEDEPDPLVRVIRKVNISARRLERYGPGRVVNACETFEHLGDLKRGIPLTTISTDGEKVERGVTSCTDERLDVECSISGASYAIVHEPPFEVGCRISRVIAWPQLSPEKLGDAIAELWLGGGADHGLLDAMDSVEDAAGWLHERPGLFSANGTGLIDPQQLGVLLGGTGRNAVKSLFQMHGTAVLPGTTESLREFVEALNYLDKAREWLRTYAHVAATAISRANGQRIPALVVSQKDWLAQGSGKAVVTPWVVRGDTGAESWTLLIAALFSGRHDQLFWVLFGREQQGA